MSSILGAREVAAKADSMQTAMTFSLVVLQIARLQLQVYTVQKEREEFNHHGIRPLLCSLPKKFCPAHGFTLRLEGRLQPPVSAAMC